MKVSQIEVALLVEEAFDNVVVENNDIIEIYDREEDKFFEEEDLPNYGYNEEVIVKSLGFFGRYLELHCVNPLTNNEWVAFYSYVKGEVRGECTMQEYAKHKAYRDSLEG